MSYFDQFKTDQALWKLGTARFVVEFHAGCEESAPADQFDDQENIDFACDGTPAHWFCAVVLVRDITSDYVIGCDTLGCCSYNSFEEFVSGHRSPNETNRNTLAIKAKNTVICHCFPSMVREAIADARKFANSMSERLAGLRVA